MRDLGQKYSHLHDCVSSYITEKLRKMVMDGILETPTFNGVGEIGSHKKCTESVSWPPALKEEDPGDHVETQQWEQQRGISFPRGENMSDSWKPKDFHIIKEPVAEELGPKLDGVRGNRESTPLDSQHRHQDKRGRKFKATKLKGGFIREILTKAWKLSLT